MSLLTTADRRFAEALSKLAYCNPFLPCRIDYEREALGREFDPTNAAWNLSFWTTQPGQREDPPNVARLVSKNQQVLDRVHARLQKSADAGHEEIALYEDLVLFQLYHQHRKDFEQVIAGASDRKSRPKAKVFDALAAAAEHYLRINGHTLPLWNDLAHMTACFFQIRRAFQNIHNFIIGSSKPTVRLRAAVWESIFTHDMHRYRRVLFDRMTEYTTLVTGPSGTGKELVARAVGFSRYLPFELNSHVFAEDFAGSFFPLNLSALSPTLIESELFGHRRGAFTGAVEDRRGWLETCSPHGTVFLDEIGDVDTSIQVKLLRMLEQRSFSRLGETQERTFHGKLIAATNRDLAVQMRAGKFREDLYYRLCSDIIVTPSLRERLADDPGELRQLVLHAAERIAGADAQAVTDEVVQRIEQDLGPGYHWPGNVRELEQSVRNVLIRKEYRPAPAEKAAAMERSPAKTGREELLQSISDGTLTADALIGAYCTLLYSQNHSYEATARRTGLDRRTVKAKIDWNLLKSL